MKLNASTVAGLELGGKPDVIFFDDDLTGFGYRLRLGAGGRLSTTSLSSKTVMLPAWCGGTTMGNTWPLRAARSACALPVRPARLQRKACSICSTRKKFAFAPMDEWGHSCELLIGLA
jgi:hypothetical protein